MGDSRAEPRRTSVRDALPFAGPDTVGDSGNRPSTGRARRTARNGVLGRRHSDGCTWDLGLYHADRARAHASYVKPHRLAVLAVTWLVGTTLVVSCGGEGGGDAGGGGRETSGTTAPPPASTKESVSVAAADATEPVAGPVTEFPVIAAPSLEGNLLGDPAELRVSVWLPPSYATSSARYPVVYFLAGFDEGASTTEIGRALEQLVGTGDAPEMILVGVSGANALGGSFYVDSPVTGNWATAIHTDLVDAIDARYRTIAAPASRGIAGFSMGGFGALDLAMRHPDVFGAVYALSPGLFAPQGMETSQMFADPAVVDGYLRMQQSAGEGNTNPQMSSDVRFSRAYGSAFAPDVGSGPPWVDYPYDEVGGQPDPAIWDRWDAGFGGIGREIDEFGDNLAQLRGIAIDVGENDSYAWIPDGVRYIAEQLDAHGIPAQVHVYEGGHGPVGPRATEVMFPFFSDVLVTE
jgi:enterochelin esterase-like enzyme